MENETFQDNLKTELPMLVGDSQDSRQMLQNQAAFDKFYQESLAKIPEIQKTNEVKNNVGKP